MMTDPDRSIDSRSHSHPQPQQIFMMEGPPLKKMPTPSTDASPVSQPKLNEAPADAEILSEDEELTLTASEVEENATDVGASRAAMAQGAERRKLKRFRSVS